MAHKKGLGSSKKRPRLKRPAARRQGIRRPGHPRRRHHRPPARNTAQARRQRRPRQGRHPLRQGLRRSPLPGPRPARPLRQRRPSRRHRRPGITFQWKYQGPAPAGPFVSFMQIIPTRYTTARGSRTMQPIVSSQTRPDCRALPAAPCQSSRGGEISRSLVRRFVRLKLSRQ